MEGRGAGCVLRRPAVGGGGHASVTTQLASCTAVRLVRSRIRIELCSLPSAFLPTMYHDT